MLKHHFPLLALLGLAACGPADKAPANQPAAAVPRPAAPQPAPEVELQPVVDESSRPTSFAAFTKNFDTWYRYTYYGIRLGRDFNGLDAAGRPLVRKAFLEKLATGKFLAMRQSAGRSGVPTYRLHAYAGPGRVEDIWTTSKQLAEIELKNMRYEGQPLPSYDFVDLNGVRYTPATTRGKILVLKCWYISCIACVKEFPALNALADQHPDVLFVSLARDKPDQLREFLKNRELKAAVVPSATGYMLGTLELQGFPTHFVVGRDGKVLRVTNDAGDLARALAKAAPLAAR